MYSDDFFNTTNEKKENEWPKIAGQLCGIPISFMICALLLWKAYTIINTAFTLGLPPLTFWNWFWIYGALRSVFKLFKVFSSKGE